MPYGIVFFQSLFVYALYSTIMFDLRKDLTFHVSFLSFRMRSRFSISNCTSSSLYLVVTISCGLTLQVCLIIALAFQWPSLSGIEHCASHTRAVHVATCLERENSSSLNFFQEIFFFFYLGFLAISRIFHSYRTDRSSKVDKNRRMWENPPDHL